MFELTDEWVGWLQGVSEFEMRSEVTLKRRCCTL